MISETRFSNSHASFWHSALPMAEACVRAINTNLTLFARPLRAATSPEMRGLINEAAGRLFDESLTTAVPVDRSRESSIEAAIAGAGQHIHNLRAHARRTSSAMGPVDTAEVRILAKRMEDFFEGLAPHGPILPRPSFAGCGWISQCVGDYFVDGTLFEFKAGERKFRTVDLRQLLTYCALNFGAKTYDVASVALVNPREGVWFSCNVNHLCHDLSGKSADELFAEILNYISEPLEFERRDP